jgi:hypothetical protein
MSTLDKADIITHENKLYGAILSGDLGMLDKLLHDDLVFVIPGGEVITKEADLNTYRDGRLAIEGLVPEIEHISVIDDTAVVVVKIGLKGKFDNTPFEGRYRYVRVWKQSGSGIKVIAGSGTAI